MATGYLNHVKKHCCSTIEDESLDPTRQTEDVQTAGHYGNRGGAKAKAATSHYPDRNPDLDPHHQLASVKTLQ